PEQPLRALERPGVAAAEDLRYRSKLGEGRFGGKPLAAQRDIDAQAQPGDEIFDLLGDRRIEAVLQHQELAVAQAVLDGPHRLDDEGPRTAGHPVAAEHDDEALRRRDHPDVGAGGETTLA